MSGGRLRGTDGLSPSGKGPAFKGAFKVVIIGESNVGKSSIFLRYFDDRFTEIEGNKSTLGVDNRSRFIKIGREWIKLVIWDTAGQERFKGITQAYYHGANGAFVVYDVTNSHSMYSVGLWVKHLRAAAGDVPIVLLGNKADDETHDDVNERDLINTARKHNVSSYLVSAQTGRNVQVAFKTLIREMIENTNFMNLEGSIRIDEIYVPEPPCSC